MCEAHVIVGGQEGARSRGADGPVARGASGVGLGEFGGGGFVY
jgi:hypothetical protein